MNSTLLDRSPNGDTPDTSDQSVGAIAERPPTPVTLPRSRPRLLIGLVVTVVLLAVAALLGQKALSGAGAGDNPAAAVSPQAPYEVDQNPGPVGRDSASGATNEQAVPAPAATIAPNESGAKGDTAGNRPGVTPVDSGQSVIRTAWLGVEVTALPEASTKVRAIAGTNGGRVISEDVITGDNPTGLRPPTYSSESGQSIRRPGMNQASIVLAVPTDKLDSVLGQLSGVGKVSVRSQSSQDVTDSVIDSKARVATMTEGVNRLRALLAKATKLEDVITLEAELGRRQAELESMQGRLANLTERSAMAQINVSLWTPQSDTPPVDDEPGNAFTDGIKKAGELLVNSSLAIIAGLAIMLPWLLLGLLGWFVVRLVLRRRTTPATATPDAAQSAQAAGSASPAATSADPDPVETTDPSPAASGTTASGTTASGTTRK